MMNEIRGKRLRLAALGVTIMGALVVLVALAGAKPAPSPEQLAVERATRATIEVLQTPYAFADSDFANGHLPDQARADSVRSGIRGRLMTVMTEDLASHFATVTGAAVDEVPDGSSVARLGGGGIDAIWFNSVEVDGSTATVEVVATTWSMLASPPAYRPERITTTWAHHVELVQAEGGWKTSFISWDMTSPPGATQTP
jgi:hypothetical protein